MLNHLLPLKARKQCNHAADFYIKLFESIKFIYPFSFNIDSMLLLCSLCSFQVLGDERSVQQKYSTTSVS